MRTFKTPDRNKIYLFTNVSLDSIAPIGSVVRTIDELVEKLNTSDIESTYDLESEKGREPIHPKTLIKVALYALHNCRFSLRKMEEDTKNHLGYRWLTGDEEIDHSTMGKFLVYYKEQIIEMFSQTVLLCIEHELVDFEILAIDTVKIRGNASYKQSKNLKAIKKEEKKIKDRLNQLIENQCDNELEKLEKKQLDYREMKLEKAKKILEERVKEKKSQARTEKAKSEIEKKEKVNITDTDVQIMEQRNGEKNPSYGVTTTTDARNDVITHLQMNQENNDAAGLLAAIEGSKEKSGNNHKVVDADSAFSSVENLKQLEQDKQDALIPDRRYEANERGNISNKEYDRSKFKYNAEDDEYRCPQGKVLTKTGIYEINGRDYNRYSNPKACKSCSKRKECTKSFSRVINRDVDEEVKERMQLKLQEEKNKELYNQRAHASESPYGQIKHNLKYKIIMRRGIKKAKMEMALLFMLHNMMRIHRYRKAFV